MAGANDVERTQEQEGQDGGGGGGGIFSKPMLQRYRLSASGDDKAGKTFLCDASTRLHFMFEGIDKK